MTFSLKARKMVREGGLRTALSLLGALTAVSLFLVSGGCGSSEPATTGTSAAPVSKAPSQTPSPTLDPRVSADSSRAADGKWRKKQTERKRSIKASPATKDGHEGTPARRDPPPSVPRAVKQAGKSPPASKSSDAAEAEGGQVAAAPAEEPATDSGDSDRELMNQPPAAGASDDSGPTDAELTGQ